ASSTAPDLARVPLVVDTPPASTTTPGSPVPGTFVPARQVCRIDASAVRICVDGPPVFIPPRFIPGQTIPGTTTTTQITQPGTVSGTIQQMTYMASGYVDLLPGARIVPYLGAGAGMAFISDGVGSCGMCSPPFAYPSTGRVGL